jgi:hypothetical protein
MPFLWFSKWAAIFKYWVEKLTIVYVVGYYFAVVIEFDPLPVLNVTVFTGQQWIAFRRLGHVFLGFNSISRKLQECYISSAAVFLVLSRSVLWWYLKISQCCLPRPLFNTFIISSATKLCSSDVKRLIALINLFMSPFRYSEVLKLPFHLLQCPITLLLTGNMPVLYYI